jgi:hypothetical protein
MAPTRPDERDPFFPGKGQTADANPAIRACFVCPVRAECDDYRKRTGSRDGVWAAVLQKREDDD